MNNHPVYSHGQPEQAAPATRMPEAPLDFYQELVRPSHSNNNNNNRGGTWYEYACRLLRELNPRHVFSAPPQDWLSGFPVSELLAALPSSSSPGDELLGALTKSSETGNLFNQS